MIKILHKILNIFFLEFWWRDIRYPKHPIIIRLSETKTQLLKYLELKGIDAKDDFILKFRQQTVIFTWRLKNLEKESGTMKLWRVK